MFSWRSIWVYIHTKIQPKSWNKFKKNESMMMMMKKKKNLHLGTTILEPEFDLATLKAKSFAELQPLLLVRMRAFLEKPGDSKIEFNGG